MAQEETKFELLKLDTNNLVEFEGWENRMKQVVEENPFIEIIDKETYKIGKKRLSNVRAERVTVENQDKNIATFVSQFRKRTMTKKDELVVIVKPLEELLKEQVDKWEKAVQDEKDKQQRIENERVDEIKHEIKRVEDLLDEIIVDSELSEINAFKLRFKETKESEFDFQEYKFMFDEMVELKEKAFLHKIGELVQNEDARLEQLKKDREARLNQMIIDGMELVDGIDGSVEERLVKQMVSGIFQTIMGEGVDFDAETFERMNQAKEKALKKVDEKFKTLKEIQINEVKKRISEVKEGLLDLVFQMTIDNYENESETINNYLKQSVIDEAKDDFENMKLAVLKAMNEKLTLLEKEKLAKEKELIELGKNRLKEIQELGFKKQNESLLVGYDIQIDLQFVQSLNDKSFDEFMEEMSTLKANSEKEKARQEKIRQDKITLVDIFVNFKNQISEKRPKGLFDNKESQEFFEILKNQFIEYCDERITNINKF